MDNYQGAKKFYQDNKNNNIESVSGWGSFLRHTTDIRRELPRLLHKYDIKSIVDCPCGDWNWMKHVNLDKVGYLGLDIVEDIIEENTKKYGSTIVRFEVFDLINNVPPRADLFICRDFLFHLSLDNQYKASQNIRASRCKFLLTTTFPNITENKELQPDELNAGWGWRPINVELPPFDFKNPIDGFNEVSCNNRKQNLYKL